MALAGIANVTRDALILCCVILLFYQWFLIIKAYQQEGQKYVPPVSADEKVVEATQRTVTSYSSADFLRPG